MEIWKDIKDYKGYYQVSNLGNVRSLDRVINTKQGLKKIQGRILKPSNSNGYRVVPLHAKELGYSQKVFLVHHLVASEFLNHTPCREIVIDHINYDKSDNRLENLQLITQRKNLARSRSTRFKSGFTGVSWNSKTSKWKSEFYSNGKRRFLGYFSCELKAAYEYNKALKEHQNQNTND
jgi:hypothetical protein